MKARRGWIVAIGDGLGLTLATGFYWWMLDRPRPADPSITQTAQPGLLHGLPSLLVITLGASLAVAAILNVTAAGRVWRTRLSVASTGLYLACTVTALGDPAYAIGAWTALVALVALFVRNDVPESGAVLLTLHAGAFATALAFFEQWARYRAGWEPFLENLGALKTLWLGG